MIELFYWPGFRICNHDFQFELFIENCLYLKLFHLYFVEDEILIWFVTWTPSQGQAVSDSSENPKVYLISLWKAKIKQNQRKCISSLNLGEQSNIITYPNPDVLILRLVEPSNQNLYLKQQGDYHQTLTAVSRKTCNQLLTASCKVNLQKYVHTQSQSAPSMYYSMKVLHYTML